MRSILSYPERGPWGDHRYRGNCTGFIVRDLIRFYNAKRVADPCEGSGTVRDVCRDLTVPYWGNDLRHGFDLLTAPLDELRSFRPELVWLHPAYWTIVRYSRDVWGELPDTRDLSEEDDWPRYCQKLHGMIERCRSVVAPRGRVAVLIGDVRDAGRYYSAEAKLHEWYGPDVVEAVIIKAQHGVSSDRKEYSGRLIRIAHEYVVILRAPGGSHG
jgi:hypothetical protein